MIIIINNNNNNKLVTSISLLSLNNDDAIRHCILSILALLVVLSSARYLSRRKACSLSSSVAQCQNGVCPSIVACIQEYEKSYFNIVVIVPDGNHFCNQTESHTLNYDLNIEIQPKRRTSTPTFTCQVSLSMGKTSFLRLQTSYVFTMMISNIIIEATETVENRGSLICIDSPFHLYSYEKNNILIMNNVVMNNAHSTLNYEAEEAGSITLNAVDLIMNDCTITNSKSSGNYSSAINNSTITNSHSSHNNHDGYGISFSGYGLKIYNSIFDGNYAESNFISASAKSSVYVQSNKFTNNKSQYGNCFSIDSPKSIEFDSNVFDNNIGHFASALSVYTHYNYLRDAYYGYYFTNNNFTNNVASKTTLYIATQGIYVLSGSIFQNNVAFEAADIYFHKQRITLLGGTFINSSLLSSNNNNNNN
ncbi:hypothetical protein PPL_04202 [Heterostelium album PN500]|uniref:Right handed beta helix domain-containing protein n=1 Tax=Heterostelium pallidum (strain ATCC 26659 / Pp 5 / PN500) TaxID=670386 RepID=D3B6X1_HETP5|nr:hypothetical protein PPL_04202 [Heterostelium album PN500]EFA82514.1 hypothetical protein PPL_04202 [Heterostelium album PN500]|eukprot:XP_020434631.1 hypothetical protein PPL_04202 [Heterostelium album PN500]